MTYFGLLQVCLFSVCQGLQDRYLTEGRLRLEQYHFLVPFPPKQDVQQLKRNARRPLRGSSSWDSVLQLKTNVASARAGYILVLFILSSLHSYKVTG